MNYTDTQPETSLAGESKYKITETYNVKQNHILIDNKKTKLIIDELHRSSNRNITMGRNHPSLSQETT